MKYLPLFSNIVVFMIRVTFFRDCMYSAEAWSACSCNGTQTREIHVQQQPQCGGTPCPPTTRVCPAPKEMDCKYVSSPWSPCGCEGTQNRTHVMISTPVCGGQPCPNTSETRSCIKPGTCSASNITLISYNLLVIVVVVPIVAICMITLCVSLLIRGKKKKIEKREELKNKEKIAAIANAAYSPGVDHIYENPYEYPK